MQYTILVALQPEELVRQVQQHLAEGWKLQGGVSSAVFVGGPHFCQAMTREAERRA